MVAWKADKCTTDEARGMDGGIVRCDEQSGPCARMLGVQDAARRYAGRSGKSEVGAYVAGQLIADMCWG